MRKEKLACQKVSEPNTLQVEIQDRGRSGYEMLPRYRCCDDPSLFYASL
jgi:hypothetical protein